jgi:hypothetical protein
MKWALFALSASPVAAGLMLVVTTVPTLGADKSPTGPEMAPKEIGHLLKAYPMLMQQNPMAPGGVGVLMWGCDYLVGKATITITVTTKPGDPMPCKRAVAFE